MGEQHIQIRQLFNAPVDTLFDILTDHESFGQVINANIKWVVDSQRKQEWDRISQADQRISRPCF